MSAGPAERAAGLCDRRAGPPPSESSASGGHPDATCPRSRPPGPSCGPARRWLVRGPRRPGAGPDRPDRRGGHPPGTGSLGPPAAVSTNPDAAAAPPPQQPPTRPTPATPDAPDAPTARDAGSTHETRDILLGADAAGLHLVRPDRGPRRPRRSRRTRSGRTCAQSRCACPRTSAGSSPSSSPWPTGTPPTRAAHDAAPPPSSPGSAGGGPAPRTGPSTTRARIRPSSPCSSTTRTTPCSVARPAGPKGAFSTLAGFVEPGESAESAVAREIGEEVGLHVTGARYVGSQPWPFPASLMLGFHATISGVRPEPHARRRRDRRGPLDQPRGAARRSASRARCAFPGGCRSPTTSCGSGTARTSRRVVPLVTREPAGRR